MTHGGIAVKLVAAHSLEDAGFVTGCGAHVDRDHDRA